MKIKKAVQVGNPVIRTKAKLVKNLNSAKVKKTIGDLIDSMRKHNLVGMAAPQIGVAQRVFVTEIRKTKLRKTNELDKLRIFVNPKIVSTSKKNITEWEGCGSVAEAGLFAMVNRPESVVIRAFDKNGQSFNLNAKGLLARVIQHEMDHLDAILFIDKADIKTCMSRSEYLKMRSK